MEEHDRSGTMGKMMKLEDVSRGTRCSHSQVDPARLGWRGHPSAVVRQPIGHFVFGGHVLLKLPLAKRQPLAPKEVMFLLCLKLPELSSALGTSQASAPAYKALRNWSPSTC